MSTQNPSLNMDDTIIKDSQSMSNSMNDFFCSVAFSFVDYFLKRASNIVAGFWLHLSFGWVSSAFVGYY